MTREKEEKVKAKEAKREREGRAILKVVRRQTRDTKSSNYVALTDSKGNEGKT